MEDETITEPNMMFAAERDNGMVDLLGHSDTFLSSLLLLFLEQVMFSMPGHVPSSRCDFSGVADLFSLSMPWHVLTPFAVPVLPIVVAP